MLTTTSAAAVLSAALSAISNPGGRAQAQDADQTPLRITTTVEIRLDGGDVVADPEDALIHSNGRFVWVLNVPKSSKVMIHFRVQSTRGQLKKGPFRRVLSNPHNKARGHYEGAGGDKIDTNAADSKGYWKYDVIVQDEAGNEKYLDPGVLIKDG